MMGFSEDYCPACGAYQGAVHLLEDRDEPPSFFRLGAWLGWASRILLLCAALVVLWALIRS